MIGLRLGVKITIVPLCLRVSAKQFVSVHICVFYVRVFTRVSFTAPLHP